MCRRPLVSSRVGIANERVEPAFSGTPFSSVTYVTRLNGAPLDAT